MVEREGGGFGRFVALVLLLWLFVLDVVLLGLAGDAFNRFVGGKLGGFNTVSEFVVLLALIEGTFLGAAVVVGLTHALHYNSGSVGAAFATAVIAWGVDVLALGFVAKEINIGGQGQKEKAIESFIIIILFFETLYFLLLLGGLHSPRLGVGYSSAV